MIPNQEIQKIMKLLEWVVISNILLIKSNYFPAEIHCKKVKLSSENSSIFRFYIITCKL